VDNVIKVVDARRAEGSCYLPDAAFNRSNTSCRWTIYYLNVWFIVSFFGWWTFLCYHAASIMVV